MRITWYIIWKNLALRPTQPTIKWVPDLYPGMKQQGRGVDHSPPSRAEVNGRVQLYLFYPLEPSLPILG